MKNREEFLKRWDALNVLSREERAKRRVQLINEYEEE